MEANLRLAENSEWADVLLFYRRSGYLSKPNQTDTVVIALYNGAIIGAVRICWEQKFAVLRGVRVLPEWQRKGVGTKMVKYAIELARRKHDSIFIIPYRHLIDFYERLGFRVLLPEKSPSIVRARYKQYCDQGYDVVVMGVHSLLTPPS